jgi:hypothetical protein
MIEPAIRKALLNDSAVKALVEDRVYIGVCAQDQLLTRILISAVTKLHPHHFGGDAGYVQGRVQIDCLAPTYPEAKALADAAYDALDDIDGNLPISEGVNADYLELEAENDLPLEIDEGDANPSTYGVSFDAVFQY